MIHPPVSFRLRIFTLFCDMQKCRYCLHVKTILQVTAVFVVKRAISDCAMMDISPVGNEIYFISQYSINYLAILY